MLLGPFSGKHVSRRSRQYESSLNLLLRVISGISEYPWVDMLFDAITT